MKQIVQLLVLCSVAAMSLADVAENLVLYQKTIDQAFNDIQNNLNAQRNVHNQAFAKLTDNVNQNVNANVRLSREQAQTECNRQVTDLTRHYQELIGRGHSEKARLEAELQVQSQKTVERIGEMSREHQIELARVRSELNAVHAQALANLRRQLEGQISVARNEVYQIQSQHEYALQHIQKKLDVTRQNGENSYRNAQRIIQQYA